jgi:acetyl-CoA acetyltransferase
MARQGFSRRAAVAGVGMTALTRESGRSVLDQATEASRLALSDAGLAAADVDAVLTYHLNDSVPAIDVARSLGVPRLGWHNELYGGGSQSASILGDAAMIIDAGLATTVLVYRALNGRSGARTGQTALRVGQDAEQQFTLPYGMAGPVHLFALAAQRYLADFGLSPDKLAPVVMQSRAYASANPRAVRREPLTAADYVASPMVASPLRRVDCCQETDGACALVITAAQRASAASPLIHAVVRGGGPGSSRMDKSDDVGLVFSSYVAPALYEAAGMTAADLDLALLYDAYSFLVPRQLEDFGFCKPGEGLEFVAAGGSELPVNPHGGLLSEGYVHGLNNVAEAVRQLRGDAGPTQLRASGAALCTGFGGSYGSAAVLVRG